MDTTCHHEPEQPATIDGGDNLPSEGDVKSAETESLYIFPLATLVDQLHRNDTGANLLFSRGVKSAATGLYSIFPLPVLKQPDAVERWMGWTTTECNALGKQPARDIFRLQAFADALKQAADAKIPKSLLLPLSTRSDPSTASPPVADGNALVGQGVQRPADAVHPQAAPTPLAPAAEPPPDRGAQDQALAEVIRHVRQILKREAGQVNRNRYEVAQHVVALEDHNKTYGAGAVDKLARKTRINRSTLYHWAAVARFWSSAEFQRLCKWRGKNGVGLSWSHFVEIASIKDPAERDRAIAAVLDLKLPIAKLRRWLERRSAEPGAGAGSAGADPLPAEDHAVVKADPEVESKDGGAHVTDGRSTPTALAALERAANVSRAAKALRDYQASVESHSAVADRLIAAIELLSAADLCDDDRLERTFAAAAAARDCTKETDEKAWSLTTALVNDTPAQPVAETS